MNRKKKQSSLLTLLNSVETTPAFILDEQTLRQNLVRLNDIHLKSSAKILFSIKALPLEFILQLSQQYLQGFSVSSLFEARLATDIAQQETEIHYTSPGLRPMEFKELSRLCSKLSFNSLQQYSRHAAIRENSFSMGLRLNPKLSFVNDQRFDPCRIHSKLGVEFKQIQNLPENIQGFHFHTVFSAYSYKPLEIVVDAIEKHFRTELSDLNWINLGGGYLINQIAEQDRLIDMINYLAMQYDIEVFLEPGKAIVGNAGYMVSSVVDRFRSDGKDIVVLDSSVNHNPEVFEYQKPPQLLDHESGCEYSCVLVGSSCLAGDVFGEYRLKAIPEIGDRFIFSNVGAYSLIKANRFNGYNLPDIYTINKGGLVKYRTYSYAEYRDQWRSN